MAQGAWTTVDRGHWPCILVRQHLAAKGHESASEPARRADLDDLRLAACENKKDFVLYHDCTPRLLLLPSSTCNLAS